jgi:hypothetical protein
MASAFQSNAFQSSAFQIDAIISRGDDAGLPWGTRERPMRVVRRDEEQKTRKPKRKRVVQPVEMLDPDWFDNWMDAALIPLPMLEPIAPRALPQIALPDMASISDARLAAEYASRVARDEEDALDMLLLTMN